MNAGLEIVAESQEQPEDEYTLLNKIPGAQNDQIKQIETAIKQERRRMISDSPVEPYPFRFECGVMVKVKAA